MWVYVEMKREAEADDTKCIFFIKRWERLMVTDAVAGTQYAKYRNSEMWPIKRTFSITIVYFSINFRNQIKYIFKTFKTVLYRIR